MNNEKKARQRPTFARSMTLILLTAVGPLILLLLISNFYSVTVSNELIAQSNRHMVSQWVQQADETLVTIESYLSGITYIEPEFGILGKGDRQLNVHLATHAIRQRMDTAINAFSALGGLFLDSAQDSVHISRFADGAYPYETREALRGAVREACAQLQDPQLGQWRLLSVPGESMLLCAFGRDGAYMVGLVDLRRLISVSENTLHLFYADAEGQVLTQSDWAERERIRLPAAQSDFSFTGKDSHYMLLCEAIPRTPVQMALAISNAGFWDGLTGMQHVLLGLSLLTILLIPIGRLLIERHLNAPLINLTQTMEKIKCGELNAQISQDYGTRELEQVKLAFNDMAAQVRDLKIEAYEGKIEHQRIELQYLHLQLRPHFFLNCLKSVYACAQRQKYQEVRELILSISDYIRYLFRDNLKTIALREELDFVRNYLRIQEMSLAMPPQCEIEVEDALLDCRLPPFCIETFVENAVKHQWKPDRQLIITVRAVLLDSEEGRYLDITVHDNGDGFPMETLLTINSLPGDIYEGHHVGLTNIRHRLRLIYGDRATLAFYNDEGGAVSEVICPLDGKTTGAEEERA